MRWSRILIACGLIAVTAGYVFVARWMISMLAPYRVNGLVYVAVARDQKHPSPVAFDVTFRSPLNLRKFAADTGANAELATFRLCDSGTWFSTRPVTHEGIDVGTEPHDVCRSEQGGPFVCSREDDTAAVRAELAHVDDPGPFTYHATFIYDEICETVDHTVCAKRAPLPMPPREDVCMTLHSTSYTPPLATSNDVRIPKKDIAKALAAEKP